MGPLVAFLRSLRAKPRGFHVALLLVLAWVPLLIYLAGHAVVATLVLIGLAAVFLTIHPVSPPPPEEGRAWAETAPDDE